MAFQYQELGALARWQVSSHKFGFSVLNLRDNNDDTFWQSEGPQPHAIDLAFPKRVMISAVHICLSHPQDDSYTPSKISISAGTSMHDLLEVRMLEVDKPDGWGVYPLRPMVNAEDQEIGGPPIPAFFLRIMIIQNHLNGKDTHVRGIRVFGLPGSTVSTTQIAARPITASNLAIPKPRPPPLIATKSSRSKSKSDHVPASGTAGGGMTNEGAATVGDTSMMNEGDEAAEGGEVDSDPDEGWDMLLAGNDGLSGHTTHEFRWIAQGVR